MERPIQVFLLHETSRLTRAWTPNPPGRSGQYSLFANHRGPTPTVQAFDGWDAADELMENNRGNNEEDLGANVKEINKNSEYIILNYDFIADICEIRGTLDIELNSVDGNEIGSIWSNASGDCSAETVGSGGTFS